MRTFLNLTLSIILTFTLTNAATLITQTTPSFFQGEWYSQGTVPSDVENAKCCVPVGNVTFSSANKLLQFKATSWQGALCKDIYLTNSNSKLQIDRFPHDGTYSRLASGSFFTPEFISVAVKNFNNTDVFLNGTQKVTFDLHLGYKVANSGENCVVTLSKAKTPYKK